MTAPGSEQRRGMLELAERCEAATGPDRKLDADIAAKVFGLRLVGTYEQAREYENGIGRRIRLWLTQQMGPIPSPEECDFATMVGWSVFDIPPFTASTDAAAALIPNGLFPLLDWRGAHCRIMRADRSDVTVPGFGPAVGFASTPALALCAAALRARTTKGNHDA